MTTNMDSPRCMELNQSQSHNIDNIVLVAASEADVGVVGVEAVPGYDTSRPPAKCCVVSTSISSSTCPFDTPPLYDISGAGASHPPHPPSTTAAHHENDSASNFSQIHNFYHRDYSQFSTNTSSTHLDFVYFSAIDELDEDIQPPLVIPRTVYASGRSTPAASLIAEAAVRRESSSMNSRTGNNMNTMMTTPTWQTNQGSSGYTQGDGRISNDEGGSGRRNHYQGGVRQQQGLLASACTSTNLSSGYHSLRDLDTTTATASITPTTCCFYETTSLNVPERSSAAGQSGPLHCYASPSYYQQPLPSSITTLPNTTPLHPQSTSNRGSRGNYDMTLVPEQNTTTTTVSESQMITRRRGVGSLALPPSRNRGSSLHSTSNTFPSNVTAGGGHTIANPDAAPQSLQPSHSDKPPQQQQQYISSTQAVVQLSRTSLATTTRASCFKLKYPPPPPSMQTYFVVGQALLPQVHSSVVNPLRLVELHTKPGTGDWSAGYGPEYAATVEDGLPASRELYDPNCEAFSKFYEVLMRWYQLTLKFNYSADGRASVTSRKNNNSVHSPNGLTSSSFLEPMSSETPSSYHHLRPSANNLPNPTDYATDFVGWVRELNRWWDAEVKPFVVVTQKRPAVVSGGGTLGSSTASPSYNTTRKGSFNK